MMQGIVDRNCEAMIRLVVSGANAERQTIDALIDTGFTGFLTLTPTILSRLNLPLYGREEGTLGDGSVRVFDVYRGFIFWDGVLKRIDINASETVPLVGMSLLYGYRLQIDTIEGGRVILQALNTLDSP